MRNKVGLAERIRKLLAVASDSTDEAEAASAPNKAYILMEADNLAADVVF